MRKTDFFAALWPFLVATLIVSWIRMAQDRHTLFWLWAACALIAFPFLVGYRIAIRGGQVRHAAIAAMTLSIPNAIVVSIYFSDFKASLGYMIASTIIACPIQALIGMAGKRWAVHHDPEKQWLIRAYDRTGAALLPK